MLIGMGGGAASSMATGANTADLDFDSVQRGNAEIERRAQEVIDRCWQLGAGNPILSIHDVGAGGLSNALPELVHGGGAGGTFELREIPSEEPGMSPREIWCNEAQERYVLAIAPSSLAAFRAICERERCPFAVVGTRQCAKRAGGARRALRQHAGRRSARRDPRQAAEDDARRRARRARRCPRSILSAVDLADAIYRVLQLPAVADKTFLVTIGDRTVGGLCSRDPMVGPWQVPVADVAVTLMDYRGLRGRSDGDGRAHAARADRCAGVGPHGGRRSDHQHRGRRHRRDLATSSSRRTGWRPPAIRARTRRSTTPCAPSRIETCVALGVVDPGRQGFDVDAHDVERGRRRARGDGAGVARSCPRSRRVATCARRLTPLLRDRRLRDRAARRRERPPAPRRLRTGAGLRPARQRRAGPRRSVAPGGVLRARATASRRAPRVSRRLPTADCWWRCSRWRSARTAGSTSRSHGDLLPALFAEELGAVVQVRRADAGALMRDAREAGIGAHDRRRAHGQATACAFVRRDRVAVRRVAHRAAPRLVVDHARDAAPARQPGGGRPGIRAHRRRARSAACSRG